MRYIVFFLFMLSCQLAQSQVKPIRLDQLEQRLAQGKDTVYVINFWATWCAPCIKELPYFEKLQAEHASGPLKVLLVSLDFKSKLESGVKPFVQKHKLKNEVFLLDEKNQQEYIDKISKEWSGALPATLVVNKKRNIRKMYEQEFTYPQLLNVYQSLK